MYSNKIRPEWIPSGYKDKPHNNSIVERSEIKHTLYCKIVLSKYGFKRRCIK